MPIEYYAFLTDMLVRDVFDTDAIAKHFGVSHRAVSHAWAKVADSNTPEHLCTTREIMEAVLKISPPRRKTSRGVRKEPRVKKVECIV